MRKSRERFDMSKKTFFAAHSESLLASLTRESFEELLDIAESVSFL